MAVRAGLAALAALGLAPARSRPAAVRDPLAGRGYASSTDRAYVLDRYRNMLGTGAGHKRERRRLRRLVCYRGGY